MPRKKAGQAPAHDKRKAALYVRVSTKHQVDKDSLPMQRKKLKEYCKMYDIGEYQIFEDDGYSAKNTDRPNFQKMMDCIRKGDYTHMIVWKVDRVSRNLLDFASMYRELKERKVTFISLNEQFDTSTPIGGAMLKIILIFAELEREMTSERVTAIMLDRAENGLWNGARPPLGYSVDPEKQILVPVPDEKETVKMIFDLYEKLHSCKKVARTLYQNGIKPQNCDEWSPNFIRHIIRNKLYIGTYIYNRQENGGADRPEIDWIIKENNHQPIITKEQFERCGSIMDQNAITRDVSELRRTKHIHIFGGKLVCNLCGTNMNASKDKARENGLRPSVFRCGRRARLLACENKLMISDLSLGPFVFNYAANLARIQKNPSGIDTPEKLEAALLSGDEFSGIKIAPDCPSATFSLLTHRNIGKGSFSPDIGKSESQDGQSEDRIAYLEKEKGKYKSAISRLTDLYMFDPDALTKEEFSERKREMTQKIQEITRQIIDLKENAGSGSTDLAFIRKASAFLVAQRIASNEHIDYMQIAVDLDNKILKDFINQIIDKIFIQDGRIMKIRFASGLEHNFVYPD